MKLPRNRVSRPPVLFRRARYQNDCADFDPRTGFPVVGQDLEHALDAYDAIDGSSLGHIDLAGFRNLCKNVSIRVDEFAFVSAIAKRQLANEEGISHPTSEELRTRCRELLRKNEATTDANHDNDDNSHHHHHHHHQHLHATTAAPSSSSASTSSALTLSRTDCMVVMFPCAARGALTQLIALRDADKRARAELASAEAHVAEAMSSGKDLAAFGLLTSARESFDHPQSFAMPVFLRCCDYDRSSSATVSLEDVKREMPALAEQSAFRDAFVLCSTEMRKRKAEDAVGMRNKTLWDLFATAKLPPETITTLATSPSLHLTLRSLTLQWSQLRARVAAAVNDEELCRISQVVHVLKRHGSMAVAKLPWRPDLQQGQIPAEFSVIMDANVDVRGNAREPLDVDSLRLSAEQFCACFDVRAMTESVRFLSDERLVKQPSGGNSDQQQQQQEHQQLSSSGDSSFFSPSGLRDTTTTTTISKVDGRARGDDERLFDDDASSSSSSSSSCSSSMDEDEERRREERRRLVQQQGNTVKDKTDMFSASVLFEEELLVEAGLSSSCALIVEYYLSEKLRRKKERKKLKREKRRKLQAQRATSGISITANTRTPTSKPRSRSTPNINSNINVTSQSNPACAQNRAVQQQHHLHHPPAATKTQREIEEEEAAELAYRQEVNDLLQSLSAPQQHACDDNGDMSQQRFLPQHTLSSTSAASNPSSMMLLSTPRARGGGGLGGGAGAAAAAAAAAVAVGSPNSSFIAAANASTKYSRVIDRDDDGDDCGVGGRRRRSPTRSARGRGRSPSSAAAAFFSDSTVKLLNSATSKRRRRDASSSSATRRRQAAIDSSDNNSKHSDADDPSYNELEESLLSKFTALQRTSLYKRRINAYREETE